MTKQQLIKELNSLPDDAIVQLACDEEWNTKFSKIEIEQNGENGAFVLFGYNSNIIED